VQQQFAFLLIFFVAFSIAAAPADDVLRAEMDAALDALARNDRPAFDEHYARVKANPRAANDGAASVLADAALVWDALFQSPFLEESSEAYKRLSTYPGYAAAVRRSTLQVGDQRFYPASDSLRFLTTVAADRLGRPEDSAALPRVARSRKPKS
jgi:hypothetical protein